MNVIAVNVLLGVVGEICQAAPKMRHHQFTNQGKNKVKPFLYDATHTALLGLVFTSYGSLNYHTPL